METIESNIPQKIYQGQFGTFTITALDRQGVVIYRSALMIAAICFGMATIAVLSQSSQIGSDSSANILNLVTWLYITFSVALGIALATIHIYMAILHRILQVFWAVGSLSALIFSLYYHLPIDSIVYQHPQF